VIARASKGDHGYAAAIEDAMVLLRGADVPAKYSNETAMSLIGTKRTSKTSDECLL
jgi:hypothetical protein